MDRYPYLGTLYYLTSVYLRGIGALFIFFLHNFIYTSQNTPIKFLAPLPGRSFCIDIDNNALDITLDQFFLFNTFYLFYLFYIRACYLVFTVCLWFQEVNLHAYEDRVKAN